MPYAVFTAVNGWFYTGPYGVPRHHTGPLAPSIRYKTKVKTRIMYMNSQNVIRGLYGYDIRYKSHSICRQGSTCCSQSLNSAYKLPETTLYYRYIGTPSCISKYKDNLWLIFFPYLVSLCPGVPVDNSLCCSGLGGTWSREMGES